MSDDIEKQTFWRSLDLAEMAREEFKIMLRAYFAPVFGTILVLRQLVQASREDLVRRRERD